VLLDLDCALQSLALLGLACNGLCTHNTTTPVTLEILVICHVAGLDGIDELGELILVFLADFGEGENSGGLQMSVII